MPFPPPPTRKFVGFAILFSVALLLETFSLATAQSLFNDAVPAPAVRSSSGLIPAPQEEPRMAAVTPAKFVPSPHPSLPKSPAPVGVPSPYDSPLAPPRTQPAPPAYEAPPVEMVPSAPPVPQAFLPVVTNGEIGANALETTLPSSTSEGTAGAALLPSRTEKFAQRKLMRGDEQAEEKAEESDTSLGITSIIAGLGLVITLFLVLAWTLKKASPKLVGVHLSDEIIQMLGRKHLFAKQYLQLIRVGGKILVVVITPDGAETLSEITDPYEIDRLAGLCEAQSPRSNTKAFREAFNEMSTKSTRGRRQRM